MVCWGVNHTSDADDAQPGAQSAFGRMLKNKFPCCDQQSIRQEAIIHAFNS